MLLLVPVYQFGPKQVVPVVATAAPMANVGKVVAWWREVNWRAFAAYSVTGGPATALGARTLLAPPLLGADAAQQLRALPAPAALQGQTVGSPVMAGSFAGKLVVQQMSIHVFQHLLGGLLFCSGLSLFWAAFG